MAAQANPKTKEMEDPRSNLEDRIRVQNEMYEVWNCKFIHAKGNERQLAAAQVQLHRLNIIRLSSQLYALGKGQKPSPEIQAIVRKMLGQGGIHIKQPIEPTDPTDAERSVSTEIDDFFDGLAETVEQKPPQRPSWPYRVGALVGFVILFALGAFGVIGQQFSPASTETPTPQEEGTTQSSIRSPSPQPSPTHTLPPPEVSTSICVQTTVWLNIRSGPGVEFAIIGWLPEGLVAEMTEQQNEQWIRIKLPSEFSRFGHDAWVWEKGTTPVECP